MLKEACTNLILFSDLCNEVRRHYHITFSNHNAKMIFGYKPTDAGIYEIYFGPELDLENDDGFDICCHYFFTILRETFPNKETIYCHFGA